MCRPSTEKLSRSSAAAWRMAAAMVGAVVSNPTLMNITWRLPSEELEKQFVEEGLANGMSGLKGHRSVGGLRASIYNAFPLDGVRALVQMMQDYAAKHG